MSCATKQIKSAFLKTLLYVSTSFPEGFSVAVQHQQIIFLPMFEISLRRCLEKMTELMSLFPLFSLLPKDIYIYDTNVNCE